jgi:hypothetical protein
MGCGVVDNLLAACVKIGGYERVAALLMVLLTAIIGLSTEISTMTKWS